LRLQRTATPFQNTRCPENRTEIVVSGRNIRNIAE
jgi:hypothetical protein